MPLVLPENRWDAWLDPERTDPSDLLEPDAELLASYLLADARWMDHRSVLGDGRALSFAWWTWSRGAGCGANCR